MFKRLFRSAAPARQIWVQKIDKKHRHWAARLQQWFQRYNPKRQKLILLFFCILACGAYSLILVHSFNADGQSAVPFRAIRYPRHSLETGEPARIPKASLAETRAAIIRFRWYADSLAAAPGGALILDSMNHAYPGLMDSLRKMEDIYLK